MARKKRASRASSRTASGSGSLSDDDLGFPEEELEALFADALADSSGSSSPQKPDKDAVAGRPKTARKQPPPDDLDIDLEELANDLSGAFDAVPMDLDASGEFDELDRELAQALADDDDDGDEDLEASMKRLLAESFGDKATLPDADDEFIPEVQAHPVEEILGLGDDGAVSFDDERAVEIARLRARIHELERGAALLELELRTKDDRVEGLEHQVVAATRQAAGIGREFEAFRRRSDRDREDLKKFAGEKVLKEFLVVYDNLGRALDHSGDDRDGPLGQGVSMILGQFTAALRRCGVEEVASDPGEVFDPQWHEAVGQEHSRDVPEGSIVRRMHVGFTLNERLLRAAMVTVSRGPGAQNAEGGVPTDPNIPSVGEAASEAGKAKIKAKAAGKAADESTDEAADAAKPPSAAPVRVKKKSRRKTAKKE